MFYFFINFLLIKVDSAPESLKPEIIIKPIFVLHQGWCEPNIGFQCDIVVIYCLKHPRFT